MPTFVRLTDYKNSEEKEKGFFEEKNRYVANQEDFFKIPGSPITYWINKIVWKLFKEGEVLNKFAIVKRGPSLPSNEEFIRKWHEIDKKEIIGNINNKKWFLCNKSGGYEKWYAKTEDVLLFILNNNKINISNKDLLLKECIIWSDARFGNKKFSARYLPENYTLESVVNFILIEKDYINFLLSYLNSKVSEYFLNITIEGQHFSPIYVKNLPFYKIKDEKIKQKIDELTQECIDISKEEWDSRETSWDFKASPLMENVKCKMENEEKNKSIKIEDVYNEYCHYWKEKFYELHKNEEELNKLFIEIYGLEDELTPDVPLEDITILKKEAKIENGELVFNKKEIIKQFISYFVGVLFGRFSLDKEGLVLANLGETLEKYLKQIPNPSFLPDDDNVVPVLEREYFEDDIVSRFKEFVKVVFGEKYFSENMRFIENAVGDIRKYFNKEFYKDHISRYKKRPIYWMITSKNGAFKALIYMHRFKPDIFARVRNEYLLELVAKIESRIESLDKRLSGADSKEKKQIEKELVKLNKELKELYDFDKILQKYANKTFEIDLDDGVKVNYCKFKEILYPISNLCKK